MNWKDLLDSRDYTLLIQASEGSVVKAAHTLARARNRLYSYARPTPTVREVYTALLEITTRVGWQDPFPTKEVLKRECSLLGLETL